MFKIITYSVVCVLLSSAAVAQSSNENMSEIPFGAFGYGHNLLHEYGSVDRLLNEESRRINGTTYCCGGSNNPECRVTEIRFLSTGPVFNHNGTWCPLNSSVFVHLNVPLPPGVQAVVCASEVVKIDDQQRVCPVANYCAAANISS